MTHQKWWSYTDAMTHTIEITKYTPSDPRLGRHVRHDSRSLNYLTPHTTDDPATLTSVRHTRSVPVFDQGQVGSCTGNAAVGCLGYAPFFAEPEVLAFFGDSQDSTADENLAVSVYSDAETIDGDGPYPPNDHGSSGLSVATVLKNRGLISGYTHATDLNSALASLAVQPVIIGVPWHQDMFTPDGDGRIHATGGVVGGHEIVLDELDVENKHVWLCNSWGAGWGIGGRAYLTWDDFATLLADQGDVTVFVPISQPAPTPAPPVAVTPKEQAQRALRRLSKIIASM